MSQNGASGEVGEEGFGRHKGGQIQLACGPGRGKGGEVATRDNS